MTRAAVVVALALLAIGLALVLAHADGAPAIPEPPSTSSTSSSSTTVSAIPTTDPPPSSTLLDALRTTRSTRASRSRPPSSTSFPTSAGGPTVSSTAYCLAGHMSDGQPARRGAVAGNRWPLGTRLHVSSSPGVGEIVTVEDRIGSGSELDFALPGDCAAARAWGRRRITVEVL